MLLGVTISSHILIHPEYCEGDAADAASDFTNFGWSGYQIIISYIYGDADESLLGCTYSPT